MDWEKARKCEHEWYTNYIDSGKCETPYCSWWESHCKKCKVYEVKCGCGFMNGYGAEPIRKELNRMRKRYGKQT